MERGYGEGYATGSEDQKIGRPKLSGNRTKWLKRSRRFREGYLDGWLAAKIATTRPLGTWVY